MNAILIMQSGNEFIAKPHTIGTTDDELIGIRDGTVAEKRRHEIHVALMRSALALEMLASGRKN